MLVKRIGADKNFNTETPIVVIEIGSSKYTLKESVDGKLCVNKVSYDANDYMSINPCSGNEVEIS